MKRFGKKWQKKTKQWWRLQQLQREGWLVTSQRENNAPFPKPWRPQAEVGVGCWRGLPSAQATQIPVTSIMCGGGGAGGEWRREEGRRRRQVGWREKADRGERGVLPVQADRSLSSLPLPSSWTRQRPADSTRTSLLRRDKSFHRHAPLKKPGPLLYLPFYYLSPFLLQHAFKLGQNTVPTRGYRFLSGPVSRPRFKEKW